MAQLPCALVSLCLMGTRCRYDGGTNPCEGARRLAARFPVVCVCPEQLGGLPTPRAPSERRGDRVVSRDGADVTAAFERGAEEACRLAGIFGARYALLKSRSPSCGTREIYDGTFGGARVPGQGVTAQALRAMGVRVYDEAQIDAMIEEMERELI